MRYENLNSLFQVALYLPLCTQEEACAALRVDVRRAEEETAALLDAAQATKEEHASEAARLKEEAEATAQAHETALEQLRAAHTANMLQVIYTHTYIYIYIYI